MKSAFLALSFLLSLLECRASAEDPDTQWILFKITVTEERDQLERLGRYNTMFECFDAWSEVEKTLPKPKMDVQIICIHTRADRIRPLIQRL